MPLRSKSKILLAAGAFLGVLAAPVLTPDARLPGLAPRPVARAQPTQGTLLGKEWLYTVQPKDTLSRIAQRHGLDAQRLLAINARDPRTPLKAGQRIYLSNRHIAPPANGAPLVVNIPDRLLYRYDGAQIVLYPVALGEPSDPDASDPKRWRTPTGTFRVVEKRMNPVWTVPKSIQEEMRAKGKEVLTKVKPGPDNPLGTRWIGLSAWGYGIHGTNAPASIGRFTTHGCIRMRTSDVEEIFEIVQQGSVVRIVYQPAKVAVEGQAVYLEVSRDVYREVPNMSAHVQRLLQEAGVADRVDPAHVRRVVKGRWGVATRVDRGAPTPFAPVPASSPTPSPSATPSPSPSPQEMP